MQSLNGGEANVMDYRGDFDSHVGARNGVVLHHWWIHPHIAGACSGFSRDPADQRAKSRLRQPVIR